MFDSVRSPTTVLHYFEHLRISTNRIQNRIRIRSISSTLNANECEIKQQSDKIGNQCHDECNEKNLKAEHWDGTEGLTLFILIIVIYGAGTILGEGFSVRS
jgi:hypothetical protein